MEKTRIKVDYSGEKQPEHSNDHHHGRQKNRRVNVVIIRKKNPSGQP
jgi:outer membrane protein OmpA-like peptidoglycan-associated protein